MMILQRKSKLTFKLVLIMKEDNKLRLKKKKVEYAQNLKGQISSQRNQKTSLW